MKLLLSLFFSFCCSFLLMGQDCPAGGSAGGASSSAASASNSFTTYGSSNSFVGSQAQLYSSLQLPGNTKVNSYFASTQEYSSIKGSPYWHKDNDVKATLVLNNESMISDIGIKYDVYANQIIAIEEDETQSVLDSRFFKTMIIEEDESFYTFKKVNPENPDKFYQVLFESDEITFFKEVQTRYSASTTHLPGQSVDNRKFLSSDKYFVVQENEVEKVNLKKKDIFSHFPEVEKLSMQEYIKTNKIKLKKEKDFVEVLAALQE